MIEEEQEDSQPALSSLEQPAELIIRLANDAANDGPLDRQSQELLRLALAIGTGSEERISVAAANAISNGCQAAEIEQTVLLAFDITGWPRGIYALQLVRNSISREAGDPPEQEPGTLS